MKTFFRLWILTFIPKVILSAVLPMSADETYYWMWSHHLQLSYFDHPPFVSWLFYAGHLLEPFGNLVRLPAVIVGHLTMWVWFAILRPHFPWKDYKAWYILALTSPFVGFGSIVATPDIPLLFFWSLSILCFKRALQTQKTTDYLALGAALGLGFCSKYHIILFVPFAIAYLIREKRLKEVSIKKTLVLAGSGLLCCLPVIIWNIQNDFASFRFQIHHGLGSQSWNPDWTLGYLGAEILLVFPFVLYAAIRATPTRELKFLPYFAWGPLLFFFCSSFRGAVELNWPNVAFPSVFALVLFSSQLKKVIRVTAFFWVALYLFAFSASAFLPEGNSIAKPFREPFRFRQLAPLQNKYEPLYASTYQIASTMWYENKRLIYKLRDMSRYDFYDTLPESLPQSDTFYVIQENWSEIPDWVREAGYKVSIEEEIEPHFVVVKISR